MNQRENLELPYDRTCAVGELADEAGAIKDFDSLEA